MGKIFILLFIFAAILIIIPTPGSAQQISANTAMFITQWGAKGTGNGQFRNPRGIAVDRLGNIYVADVTNDRIQKFSGTGIYITQWGTLGNGNGQFYNPYGIAVDSSGNVYVTDNGMMRIDVF